MSVCALSSPWKFLKVDRYETPILEKLHHPGKRTGNTNDRIPEGFSYLSKSGSRGHLIWEKQPANTLNWEN